MRSRGVKTSERSIRRALRRWEIVPESSSRASGPSAGVSIGKDGAATATTERIDLGERGGLPLTTQDAERYLRERWGLPEDEWIVGSITVNEWEGPVAGGGITTYAQAKGTFRKIIDLKLLVPVSTIAPVARPHYVTRPTDRPVQAVVMFDHQAPYHDPVLHAASVAMVQDLQPAEVAFGGDLCDFPTISRHADHAAAMATPQECLVVGHNILRDHRDAAPDARMRKIRGNHDWRIEGEILQRAERLAYLRPVGEDVPAMSLRRLLALDSLHIDLIEDPRGWQHDEIELIPGHHGLVIRHGWLTGANTAERSLKRRGRSLIVGHTHTREHVFWWDPSLGAERQGLVAGTMSHVRNVVFPHFAPCDDWTQGCVVVTMWPSGTFQAEHARFDGGALYLGSRSWRPTARAVRNAAA